MDLPLGKIAILIGAGLVGSILIKENRLLNVSSLFSGAFKGWKLSDLMSARRRSLADARRRNTIRKQLESVNSSILVLERQLSSRIELLDTAKRTGSRYEVTRITSEVKAIEAKIASFQRAVQKLEIRRFLLYRRRIDRTA